MKIDVITSFNQRYYDLIGHRSVASWLDHWPCDLSLTCYTENMLLPHRDRIETVSFDELDSDYWKFQNDPQLKSRVKTFAKKAWCFMHSARRGRADRIIWLDADVISLAALSMEFVRSLLPDQALSTHLGVRYTTDKNGQSGDWLVPETGFFAINTQHSAFDLFISEYRRRYISRDRCGLRRFYDNDVYGAALEAADAVCVDLCEDLTKPYKTPLSHTVLGPYLHHYKARHSKQNFYNDNQ